MEALLLKYGYAILFLGVMVEGEAFVLAAAFLAHKGYFSLAIVIVLTVVANTVANQFYYFAARARGLEWLETRYGDNPRYQRLLQIMDRHGRWLLVVSRYAYGFRIIICAACGALKMAVGTFTVLNVASGILWAVPSALLGYYGGRHVEGLLRNLHKYAVWIPLVLALVAASVYGVRQVRRAISTRDLRLADLHALVPLVMGLMGLLNLASAIVPRSAESVRALERWLPLEVMQRSRPLMLFAGLALLQVTRSLARRKELAWYIATLALSISLVSHVGRGFDFHHSLVAAILLAYLLYFRKRFYGRSDPGSLRWALLMAPVLALVVFVYAFVGLGEHRNRFSWEPGATPTTGALRAIAPAWGLGVHPLSPRAAEFLVSLQIASSLGWLYLLVLFLRPVIQRERLEAPPERVAGLFRAHGRHSLSAFAVQGDKHHLLVAGGGGLVGYAVRGSVALACGDPLCSEEDLERGIREYRAHCEGNGWSACVYEAAEERLPLYRSLGFHDIKMAEEAIVDLACFDLAGGRRASLRAMVHKARRTGLTVRRYERAKAGEPDLDEQLEEISEEWLEDKHLAEMGFTVGRFSLDALGRVPVFLCEDGGGVLAFCSWLPYRDGRAAVLHLMRKRRGAPAGTMDLLLAESLAGLKSSGLEEASLASAPLANVGEPRGPVDKGTSLLFENLNAFYGYKNLFQFKKKFAPAWEGRHLVYPGGTDLVRVASAVARVHSSGGLLHVLLGR